MRGIREEESYQGCCARLGLDAQRLDDILIGVTFSLARDPDQFEQIRGTRFRILLVDAWPGLPALRIYFVVEEFFCDLVWIEPQDEIAEEEDRIG